jgi:hypothetical protein
VNKKETYILKGVFQKFPDKYCPGRCYGMYDLDDNGNWFIKKEYLGSKILRNKKLNRIW